MRPQKIVWVYLRERWNGRQPGDRDLDPRTRPIAVSITTPVQISMVGRIQMRKRRSCG